MILKFITNSALRQPIHFKFASAAAAAIDYYSLLGVERGATTSQIQQAFRKITKNINLEENSAAFSRLTEAFVILSDGKARDAYDSLIKVRKFSYINEPAYKPPSTQSYVTERKVQRQKQFLKKHNIDKFGRYRGGLPRPGTLNRGNAFGPIGTLYHPHDAIDAEQYPQYQAVDATRAQSFKNFHQDERQYRTAKRPWFSMKVDYQFFTFRTFLDRLGYLRHFIIVFILLPILYERMLNLFKRYGHYTKTKQRQQHKRLKAQRAQRAERQKNEKLAKAQAQAQALAKANQAKQVVNQQGQKTAQSSGSPEQK